MGFNPAVVQISAAVEHHLLDAFGDGALGDQFADGDRGVAAASRSLEAGAQLLVNGGGGAECALGRVVDDLGVDVVVGAEHGQPRTVGGSSDVTTQTPVAFLRLLFAGQLGH